MQTATKTFSMFQLKLQNDLKEKIKGAAKEHKWSMQVLITDILEKFFKQ